MAKAKTPKAKAKAAKKAPKKTAARTKAPARKKVAARPKRKAASPRPSRASTSAGERVLDQARAKGLMARLSPPVQPMVARLRALFLESAPEAVELFEESSAAYFAEGVFARIEPHDRAVIVRFLRGHELPSSAELSGDGPARTLVVSSMDELRTDVLRKLVREAVMINLKLAHV